MNIMYPIPYNTFYEFCEKVFAEARISKYNSKYSNMLYSNHYHLFLILLKAQMNVSYRRITQIVKENKINRTIAYSRVPHYSTLQRVASNLDRNIYRKLIFATNKVAKKYSGNLAIDGTGISTINPSHHYTNRINAPKVKGFIKTSIVIDTETKFIINADASAENIHDNKHFLPLIKETLLKLKLKIRRILADKGYDSSGNFKFSFENDIEPQIPIRNYPQTAKGYGDEGVIHSKYRKKGKRIFDETKYHKRSVVESINSAFKRKYGSFVRAKIPLNQEKEVFTKLIVYNLDLLRNSFFNLKFLIQNLSYFYSFLS